MGKKGPRKTKAMSDLKRKYTETRETVGKLIAEKEKVHESYLEDVQMMDFNIQKQLQQICNDREIVKLKLQRQEKELELWSAELHKREAVNQKKRKRLAKEIEQNAAKNSLLQEQRKANESMMKLANDHMNEKEKLLEKIIFLKKQLDGKQVSELQKEKERLKGQINAIKYRRGRHLEGKKKKTEDIGMNLHDKDEELEDLKCLNEALFDKQCITNFKLKETREELIQVQQAMEGEGEDARLECLQNGTLREGVSCLLKIWKEQKSKRIYSYFEFE